jgi:hypothetical protein
MFTASLPGNSRPIFRAFAWSGPRRKHSFPYTSVTFLRGGWCVYRPSHRNGSSATVACHCCRENVYGHSLVLHNLTMDCLQRICVRRNLFTNPLPNNGCTCNNTVTCGMKAATHASAGRDFTDHVPVVTRNAWLLWVLMELLETYPW